MSGKMPQAKTVGYELLHAARLHRVRMAQLLHDLGLFPGQDQVLTALRQGEGLTMGDLAEILRVRPPTVSKAVLRLTAQGLVERRSTPGDARLVRVYLTEEGQRRAISVEAVWRVLEDEATEGLGGKDSKWLRKALRDVGRNLSAAAGGEGDHADRRDVPSAAGDISD
jgi:DNA-binding MarR family transcriptional regulator